VGSEKIGLGPGHALGREAKKGNEGNQFSGLMEHILWGTFFNCFIM
jgi:hypothetical protein